MNFNKLRNIDEKYVVITSVIIVFIVVILLFLVILIIRGKNKTYTGNDGNTYTGGTGNTNEVPTQPELTVPQQIENNISSMPDSYDMRPKLLPLVLNQGSSGTCYCFGPVKTLENLYYIATGNPNYLSVQFVISCHSNAGNGVGGGSATRAMKSLQHGFTVPSYCVPFLEENSGENPNSTTSCSTIKNQYLTGQCTLDQLPKYSYDKVYTVTNSPIYTGKEHISGQTKQRYINRIKYALTKYNLVVAQMNVYRDLYNLTGKRASEIYKSNGKDYVGGHCIVIVGWFTDATSGENAWIVSNSWGRFYGVDGYFYISFDDEYCQIVNGTMCGTPLLSMSKN